MLFAAKFAICHQFRQTSSICRFLPEYHSQSRRPRSLTRNLSGPPNGGNGWKGQRMRLCWRKAMSIAAEAKEAQFGFWQGQMTIYLKPAAVPFQLT
jgi:hypothetical protein